MSNLPSYRSRRSPTQNALIGFVFTIIAFFLFGWLPTQWFAAHYAYDPNLGEPVFRHSGFALYMPTDWILWGLRFGDIPTLKSSVHTLLFIGGFSFILALLSGILLVYWLVKATKGMAGLHGTARWADKADVEKTGFISGRNYKPSGVVVGSVMMDRRGRVIHPNHKKYADRYEPHVVRGKGFRYFQKEPVRDKEGRPKFKLKKSVVAMVELLRDGANTHLFAFCPTRSGKGVGMVLPTLLTMKDSIMCNDPKGEAYALTAGFRASAGQDVIKFEPACLDGTGARWNPLDEIRIFTPYDVQDAQMIMSMACDPKGEGLDDYFDKAGYEFLMGLALHMRYAEANGSLEGVALFLGDPSWDNDKQMYMEMMNATHDPEGKMGWVDSMGKPTRTHPIIANTAKTMLNKEDKDRSGVLSTAKSLLSLYLDPIVARNTNCSDFLVRDLMTGKKPVSLYYVVGPADMERMVPLTRLFYALFIRRNAADMAFAEGQSAKNYTFPLLMILDEMASLRKLPILQEALGYVAGYGIRMFLLAQDITQVEDIYGDKQTIDSGAATRIVYAPNKIETAEKLARMTGKTTIEEEKNSNSRELIGIKPGSVSTNLEKVGRDLMTADEFMSLHDQDVVVFVKGQPPIYGRKAFYYENPVLLGRAKMPPPKRSAVLRQVQKADEQAVEEKTPAEVANEASDKWAASRAALKASLKNVLNDNKDNAPKLDDAEGSATSKLKSRYMDQGVQVSNSEMEQVKALARNVALVDKVAKLSAFNS